MYKVFIVIIALLPISAQAGRMYASTTGQYMPSANADGKLSANGTSVPLTVDFNDGWGGLGAVGYNVTPNFRTELEAGYRELEQKSQSITYYGTTFTESSTKKDKALTGMVNMYYDFPTGKKISPYVGAGMGVAHQVNGGHSNAFAYQGMAGLNYKASEYGTAFAGYRYFETADFENKYEDLGIGTITESARLEAHAVDIGYRVNF